MDSGVVTAHLVMATTSDDDDATCASSSTVLGVFVGADGGDDDDGGARRALAALGERWHRVLSTGGFLLPLDTADGDDAAARIVGDLCQQRCDAGWRLVLAITGGGASRRYRLCVAPAPLWTARAFIAMQPTCCDDAECDDVPYDERCLTAMSDLLVTRIRADARSMLLSPSPGALAIRACGTDDRAEKRDDAAAAFSALYEERFGVEMK